MYITEGDCRNKRSIFEIIKCTKKVKLVFSYILSLRFIIYALISTRQRICGREIVQVGSTEQI